MGREREGKREKFEGVEEGAKDIDKDKREDVKSKRKMKHSSDSESGSDSDSGGSESSDSGDERRHKRSKRKHRSSKRRSRKRHSDEYSDSDSGSSSYESDSEYSDESQSESEEERRRRKRKERKKREEREREKDRKRRRREKETKRRKRDDGDDKRKKKKKEKKKDKGKKGPVTNSWGKYGIIKEVDMWNKRPEFTAWLLDVKEVNLESLPNWEEKNMFKEYMEDYNTATFSSKKYYNLDIYHKNKMAKQMRKGMKKVVATERTVFNDEEQRRLELLQEREKQKQQEVVELKNAMQSGMAQAMKEQARLKEEMQYLYKVGNYEAAAVIQRKLDPDVAIFTLLYAELISCSTKKDNEPDPDVHKTRITEPIPYGTNAQSCLRLAGGALATPYDAGAMPWDAFATTHT
ncbi:hypothetical protein V2J09_017174 [Rumex salicifolius]